MAKFIDFRALRAQLDFTRVLAFYGVQAVSVRDQQLSAHCPFPTHLGVRAKPSFSADLGRGIWRCFGCKTSGNVLDFAVRMEGNEPKEGAAVREVALKLQKHFSENSATPAATPVVHEQPETLTQPIVVNGPLGFALKNLDPTHEALASLAIAPETIAHFNLGYCGRGFLKGRIAIPLYDPAGVLIGYAGRRCENGDAPLYIYPTERLHDGILHRFAPEHFVYGLHSLASDNPRKLFIADDFTAVWHLWEAGVPAVSIPTTHITTSQAETLRSVFGSSALVFLSRSSSATSQ